MPLPSSGPISLLDLKNEFGGVTPISLRDYYSGGKYVPANTVGALGVIPSSGPLFLKHFRGAQLVKNYVFTPVYNYSDGGAGNGDYNSSYNGGNGAGLGGAGTPNYRGGPGLNGYVGAEQSRNRHNNTWYQNWGVGGGGFAGNGIGYVGGIGGGGGGGSLGGNGGAGGVGFVRITW